MIKAKFCASYIQHSTNELEIFLEESDTREEIFNLYKKALRSTSVVTMQLMFVTTMLYWLNVCVNYI